MGKASKWFKGLFGFKKSQTTPAKNSWWSFTNSHNKKDHQKSQNGVAPGTYDAMAAAAAAVVKLSRRTHVGGGAGYGRPAERAAVVIQSHFRAYLSRRALKALKALVKVQALIRGQIMRKRVQEMARAPTRTAKSSPLSHTQRLDHTTLARSSTKQHQQLLIQQRNGSRSRSREHESFTRILPTDYDNILQIDTRKPKHKNIFHQTSPLSIDANFSTAENSPLYYSALSRLSCHSDYPSYMAYTQSSMAKLRSVSAPKQRPHYQKSSPGRPRLKNPKPYPGSGRLDRNGMPVTADISGFGAAHWQRYC